MKAQTGDRVRLISNVSYGSVYGLIEIPKDTELTVLRRMDSNDGIQTVEEYKYEGVYGKTSFPYGIWDRYYEII